MFPMLFGVLSCTFGESQMPKPVYRPMELIQLRRTLLTVDGLGQKQIDRCNETVSVRWMPIQNANNKNTILEMIFQEVGLTVISSGKIKNNNVKFQLVRDANRIGVANSQLGRPFQKSKWRITLKPDGNIQKIEMQGISENSFRHKNSKLTQFLQRITSKPYIANLTCVAYKRMRKILKVNDTWVEVKKHRVLPFGLVRQESHYRVDQISEDHIWLRMLPKYKYPFSHIPILPFRLENGKIETGGSYFRMVFNRKTGQIVQCDSNTKFNGSFSAKFEDIAIGIALVSSEKRILRECKE